MDVRRHSTLFSDEPIKMKNMKKKDSQSVLYLINAVFFGLFFSMAYFLLLRWREKIRNSTPLHFVTISEIAAICSLIASFIYLMVFFGISFVLYPFVASDEHVFNLITKNAGNCLIDGSDEDEFNVITKNAGNCLIDGSSVSPKLPPLPPKIADIKPLPKSLTLSPEDKEVVRAVVSGSIPSYSLELKLGDCRRAAAIRHEAVESVTGKSLEGLPVEGFDYDSILGQCCEMPIGVVQIPVGVAGPLLLDGKEYTVPMATTEGCLVASTNRGCKAIYVSGGASAVVLRDADREFLFGQESGGSELD